MNSGFKNIYLAASQLGKYSATIHLDFFEIYEIYNHNNSLTQSA